MNSSRSVRWTASDGRADYRVALDVVADYDDEAKSLVTHRFGLEDVNRAFESALDKSTKSINVHLKPNG